MNPIQKSAELSSCLRHRYLLTRVWNEYRPVVNFIMLNPSTADSNKDDPTIRKCMRYAFNQGYGSIVVTNLFTLRTPSPEKMKAVIDFKESGGTLQPLLLTARRTAQSGGTVVCAWGNHGTHLNQNKTALMSLHLNKIPLFCLRESKDGHPSHPLYLPGSLTFKPYDYKRFL